MKIVATLWALIVLGAASPAYAQYARAPLYGSVLPPFEAMTIIRSMGFQPTSRPVLRGPVYVIQALDDEDVRVRVVIDAQSGRVVRVTESGFGPNYARVMPERRFEGHMLPPETVPPGTAYRPYDDMPPPAAQTPPRPRVAARPPLPRPAPPESKAVTPPPIATPLPDPKQTPGKSIPAPVAKSAAASDEQSAGGDVPAGNSETEQKPAQPEEKPTELVPVAPLE